MSALDLHDPVPASSPVGESPSWARLLDRLRGMAFIYRSRPHGAGDLAYVSDGVRSLFGLSASEARADLARWLACVHPDDRARFVSALADSRRALHPWRLEFRILTPAGETRWAEGEAEPEPQPGGGALWHGFIHDITAREQARAAAHRHARLQELISEAATRFIHLPLEEVGDAVIASLGDVANFLGADRAYAFAYDYRERTCSNTHEWCAAGIEPQIDNLQNCPMEAFPELLAAHEAGQDVYIPRSEAMPPGSFREMILAQDIKSLILVPMMGPDACRGFVGFDAVRAHRAYTTEEQRLLRVFARMLVSVELRRSAQDALEHSERRFADVIAAAGEFVWEADHDWRLTYLSSRAADILGQPAAHFLGGDARAMLGATEADLTGPVQGLATDASRPDCSTVHLRTNVRPVQCPSGGVAGYLGLTNDVTREQEAMRALARERDQFATFFRVAIDLLCVSDREGRFVKASPAWSDLLGVPFDTLPGRRFLDFVHPEDGVATRTAFAELELGRPVVGFVNRYRAANGSYRDLEWHAHPADGLIFACARDVTDARSTARALAAALEQERATAEIKGRLVSMASHEFRTPLASILLNVELLQFQAATLAPEDLKKRFALIADSASHLSDIVTDVLDYSTLGRAGSSDQPVELDLPAFLRAIAAGLPAGGAARVQVEAAPDLAPVHTRASLLRRAVGNLLENAVKYSPAGGPVFARARRTHDGLEIEVEDQGIGVPPDAVGQLFQPFYRGSNVGRVRGTGLGLAIAREAMERLGGRIDYRPAPTCGSLFRVTLLDEPPTPSHA